MTQKFLFITFIFCLIFSGLSQKSTAQTNLIPYPKSIVWKDGSFNIDKNTIIYCDELSEKAALLLSDYVFKASAIKLKIDKLNTDANIRQNNYIYFKKSNEQNLESEGYNLEINKDNVNVEANKIGGFFMAVQTLRQLTPIEANNISYPSVKISEKPAFKWRGMLLDVGRHFFPKEDVKTYIDYLAFYKFNVLHFHLTEDQGWRIQIKKYPKLTDIGAWRIEEDGSRYGGFYTQDDIREIVKYAGERGITVVPEIELPGHSTAAIASYPEISCTGGPFKVINSWGVFDDVYCAGKEQTFTFLEDVLKEIFELFPSEYIHIGGDECPKVRWKACPDCKKRIKDNGLKNTSELQSYFIKRIEKFINTNGKRIIGWDEILEGGISSSATAQVWRDSKYAKEAAESGCDVIMSPTSHCYFDYNTDNHDVENVYTFSPIPKDFPNEFKKHILGGECALWSEHIPDKMKLDYRVFPRLLAMSENLWNGEDKAPWADFNIRLQNEYPRLKKMGIIPGPEAGAYSMKFSYDKGVYNADLKMKTKGIILFYTLDGTKPETTSAKVINNKVTFTDAKNFLIQGFKNGALYGPELGVNGEFIKHNAIGAKVKLINNISSSYTGTGENKPNGWH